MRKTVTEQITALVPVLMLLLASINIYIFVIAADQLMVSSMEAAEVSQPSVVQDNLSQLESEVVVSEVVLSEQKEVDGSAVREEFGCDAASLAEVTNNFQVEEVRQNIRSAEKQYDTYRVVRGDSLYWIAEQFGTTVAELMKLNQLDSTVIHVNQKLLVPAGTLREYPCGLKLTDKEVEWIAQMIHAEARGEPYLGQVAVGAVIINRLKSSQFPNTVRGVLFQEGAFQPIRNGSFYRPANEQAYRAALEALNGHDPTNGALFFFNPKLSNDRFMHSRTPVVTIGQHRFTY
ncbi:MAG: LysM peptidoglycan-binding domain-containing protein [Firmicutes bacterium]|jgi:LysM repeat protein|nr:LysM peptidoglycan-binding domain-containing protein [Bacillota bacterium]